MNRLGGGHTNIRNELNHDKSHAVSVNNCSLAGYMEDDAATRAHHYDVHETNMLQQHLKWMYSPSKPVPHRIIETKDPFCTQLFLVVSCVPVLLVFFLRLY